MKVLRRIGHVLWWFMPVDARGNDLIIRKGWGVRRKLWIVGAMQFITGFAALLAMSYGPEHLDPFAGVVLGLMLGWSSWGAIRRSQAYAFGWIDGRSAMVRSLQEASERRMPFIEWITAEIDRTSAAVGIMVSHSVPAETDDENTST